jgi:hypothetical protein
MYFEAWQICHSFGQRHRTKELERWARQRMESKRAMTQAVAARLENEITALNLQEIPLAPMSALSRQPISSAVKPGDVEPGTSGSALGDAGDRFVEYLKGRRLSCGRTQRVSGSLKRMYEVLARDTDLSTVAKEHLERIVAYFLSRPLRDKTSRPMSVDTVVSTLRDIRQFFDWLDGDAWEAPRRLDKIFTFNATSLLTPLEQKEKANGKVLFELSELQALYGIANQQQRLYMLLALNCGFAQKEIATLLRADVQIKGKKMFIDRIRHKTRAASVRGRWELWPETQRLLMDRMNETVANEAGLAMLTSQGKPLVHDETRSDSVAQTWGELLAKARKDKVKVRPLSFGKLRKTSSDWILRLSGSEAIQQLHLAQAPRTVAAKHYTGPRDYLPLEAALRVFRTQLLQTGVLPPRPRPNRQNRRSAD